MYFTPPMIKPRFHITRFRAKEKGGENDVSLPFCVITNACEEGAQCIEVIKDYVKKQPCPASHLPIIRLGSQSTISGKIVQRITPIICMIRKGATPQ